MWILQMAWRDARRKKTQLFIFVLAITVGLAAMVAINTLGNNVNKDIERYAKELLGADLLARSNKAPDSTQQQLLESIEAEKAKERAFNAMAYFPNNEGTRFVDVKALEGDFPFYGEIETAPAQAEERLKATGSFALVDQVLMSQFDVQVGDSVRIGKQYFTIAGRLLQVPGQATIASSVLPSIYISLRQVPATELVQVGSRVRYRYYYQFQKALEAEEAASFLEKRLAKEGFRVETVASRKETLGETFENFTDFLALVGFIALLLGCLSVASAVNIYLKDKQKDIATLRCLGASSTQALLIYFVQMVAMAIVGSLLGVVLGSLLQFILPSLLQSFIPFEVSIALSWVAIGQGLLIGIGMALLFAWLPLLSIRQITPLQALRVEVQTASTRWDRSKVVSYLAVPVVIMLLAQLQLQDWTASALFTLFLVFTLGVIAFNAWSLRWLLRRFFPTRGPYTLRQSIANLYRPQNQTLQLMIIIGLGTAFMATLFFSQQLLTKRFSLSMRKGERPNVILFDIQRSQAASLKQLVQDYKMPVIQQVPIVTMRLASMKGRDIAQIQQDSTSQTPDWVLTREYRSTYSDTLTANEKLSKGQLKPYKGDTVWVSVEQRMTEQADLQLGDPLVFNVQGRKLTTYVGSIRVVNWQAMQTNVLVLFPTGVLENAPQQQVMLTRLPNTGQTRLAFQRAVVRQFPNVSVIDLQAIISTVDELTDKISFVIQFMAFFSIFAGFLGLLSALQLSRYQRLQENVLLRVLGASARTITKINALEYVFLGTLAAINGLLLAILATWLLAIYAFSVPFQLSWGAGLGIWLVITSITLVMGLLNSWQRTQRTPLEALRMER